MTLIAICGLIGTGKDTIADFLVNDHGYARASFAGALKDAVAAVFSWDRELLEGRTDESRVWRETVDPWWANRLEMPELTPRLVLQLWGTEVCRKGFHDSIWVASVENKLRLTDASIVLTDCRFPNEINAMRAAGAKIVWVKRGELPSWYSTAIRANSGDVAAAAELRHLKIHASETSWAGSEFDVIIENTGTLLELKDKVTELVR